jgi:hypothetical protein
MLEILKNEDGIIIKKLSERKILVERVVRILTNDGIVIDTIEIKVRYKMKELPFDTKIKHYELLVGGMGNNVRKVSSKLGIKMKDISVYSNKVIMDNMCFNKLLSNNKYYLDKRL